VLVRILIAIPKILWKVGLIGLLNFFIDNPILSLLPWLGLFVFLDLTLYQGLAQIFGNLYNKVAHRSDLRARNEYVCIGNYILPFDGKWTVFNGGVDKALSHSWGIISQRYAYDFIILDDEGKSHAGDNKSLQSYYCYGKEVISPADGIVVKVSRRHKDSRVNGSKAYCDTWDIRGNYITIKHAESEYSLIAHLAPDSIIVDVGDNVKQGDIIAKCGNTGNTSEPHVHFQLQTKKSFFLSAGLPIAFSGINAYDKTNYSMADKRATEGNLQEINGKKYIGRGLEVENAKRIFS